VPVEFPPPPPSVPAPGQFSHIAVATGGDLVALSGQTGRRPDGSFDSDIAAQARQAFATVGALLEAVELAWSAVVSLRTYVVGREHIPAFREAREAIYAETFPGGQYPANTLLIVAGLGRPEALVEIEVLASR
jgi:2-iminobutanoate/2-iminopropanoate deaminase